jgi:glycosyltransferase involved in cell wall biosynthesis
MKISLFTTVTDPIERQDTFNEVIPSYRKLANQLVIVDGSKDPKKLEKDFKKIWDKKINYEWPEEFSFEFIGQQFQRGYDACDGDWVIRLDCDFVFKDEDIEKVKQAIHLAKDYPSISFYKRQFLLCDRFSGKSNLVLAFNKKKFGNKIRLDSGKDLCQASLDGKLIDGESYNSKIPFNNYDFLKKTKDVVKKEFGRMARAWQRKFGDYKLGGPDDESAFKKFMSMQLGRYKKDNQIVPLSFHTEPIQKLIKRMTKQNFGYSLWNSCRRATYFRS